MPHLGQVKALVGTLRKDGTVFRVENSLTSKADPLNALQDELGNYILTEGGDYIYLDP